MRVLIYEGGYRGHRLSYAADVAEAVASLGVAVVLALPSDAVDTPEFRTFVEPVSRMVTVDACIPAYRWNLAGAALERCLYLRKAVARLHPDHVLVPHADGMAQALGALPFLRWGMRIPVELLVMRGSFLEDHSSLPGKVKALASRLTLTRGDWAAVHLIDFRLWDRLSRESDRFMLMPDPVRVPVPRSKAEARRRLGLEAGGTYVTIAGAIDDRKGVRELADAVSRTSGPPITLLLAGKQTREVADYVAEAKASARLSIVSLDRFLSPDDLDDAICAADVVATVYRAHVGPASILVRALAANRPVIGNEDGWIGEVIRRVSGGWTCTPSDRASVVAALRRAVTECATFDVGPAARAFVQFNSRANFQSAWTRVLRSRLGLPRDEAVVPFPLAPPRSESRASDPVRRVLGGS